MTKDTNTGYGNTGDWNTGYGNTGNRNTGNWNTGDWNTCDRETGFFNTEKPNTIRVFNKPCSVEAWREAEKPDLLCFLLTEWVCSEYMTGEEKEANPSHETTGGYLKTLDYKEAFQKSWVAASQDDREKVKRLPNFDADVFYEISGIRVDEEPTKEMTVAEIEAALGHKVKVVK